MAMPSSTAMVLNSRATPPAAWIASDTMRPTGCRWVWPGTNSVKLLATATIGLPKSSRATPAARLRRRREQLSRADFGLPTPGRSRTGGLRREEVSSFSGVSVTWYTWLEQGRDIHPSREVLDAVARTLRLSGTEHAYVLSLAG